MKKISPAVTMLLMSVVLVLCAGIAGCTSPAPSSPSGTAHKLSTLDPSQMGLDTSDLPANFTLVEKYQRNASDMNSWALNTGWKKGYGTYFETQGRDVRGLNQVISIYPAENITLVVPQTVKGIKNWTIEDTNVTVEELPVPGIGDFSRALKVTQKDDPINMYMIAFVKYDVYEEMYVNGSAHDYETLLRAAEKAAAKIQ